MAGSTNSQPNSTEPIADLSQNLDEASDLQLALASLGGLRHAAACEATERSQRRYDDRNHRLHETRMKSEFGMEGEEREEPEEMSQQVLIRSPIVHNHYPNVPPTPQQPTTPPLDSATRPADDQQDNGQAKSSMSQVAKLLATGLISAGLGAGAGSLPWLLSDRTTPPAAVDTDTQYEFQGMGISSNGDESPGS